VKFCTAKRTQVRVGHAKFDVNRCNKSPLWGEKADARSLPLRGIQPVNKEKKTSKTVANWLFA